MQKLRPGQGRDLSEVSGEEAYRPLDSLFNHLHIPLSALIVKRMVISPSGVVERAGLVKGWPQVLALLLTSGAVWGCCQPSKMGTLNPPICNVGRLNK